MPEANQIRTHLTTIDDNRREQPQRSTSRYDSKDITHSGPQLRPTQQIRPRRGYYTHGHPRSTG